jgi:uncharacterized protein YfaP (DUF2135 family)
MSWKKPLIVGLIVLGAVGLALGSTGPLRSYGYEQTCGAGVCGAGSHVALSDIECRYYLGDLNQDFIWVTVPDFFTVNGGLASQYATWRPVIYHWNGTNWDETDLAFEPTTKIGYLEYPPNFSTYRKVPVTTGGYYYLQYDIWWYSLDGVSGWSGRDWQYQRHYISYADPSSTWCWYPDLSHGAVRTANAAIPGAPPTSLPGHGASAPTTGRPAAPAATAPPQPSPSPSGVAPAPPVSTTSPLVNPYSAASTRQYQLPNADGQTWTDIDPSRLSLTFTPAVRSVAIITANSDLWTNTAGFNQDLGVFVSVNGGADTLIGWKESGGYGGTFSPNAAFLNVPYAVSAGATYLVKLKWKTNKPAPGATIFAGAGPIGSDYSPTRLSAKLVQNDAAFVAPRITSQQYHLTNSDGSTWQDLDPQNLSYTMTPTADVMAVVSANSDLWTADAGYNQDLAINVNGSVVAWKESGGFAGTFSPNAAYLQSVIPMTHGVSYTVKLQWKVNRPAMGATIFAGAGPISGGYSPTSMTVELTPAIGYTFEARGSDQYHLSSSDGSAWQDLDAANLTLRLQASRDCRVRVAAGADLWTATAGYNQDIGISVDGTLIAWKESGGYAGTYSPNAAFVQSVVQMAAGRPYSFKVQWKANRDASGATIFAGAGPVNGKYSPSSLSVEAIQCS